jgi:hypothetical protein
MKSKYQIIHAVIHAFEALSVEAERAKAIQHQYWCSVLSMKHSLRVQLDNLFELVSEDAELEPLARARALSAINAARHDLANAERGAIEREDAARRFVGVIQVVMMYLREAMPAVDQAGVVE